MKMGTKFVDSLLSKIDDESLRTQLTNEFNKLRDNKEFGLVFERHIPEYVRLYKREITEGAHVQLKSSKSDDIFTVREIKGKKVKIANKDGLIRDEKIDDLAVVMRHGESIYPGLVEVDRVERGGDKPFHTVINAENYHALQLLLYTHEGKIDCIYIDPPYNTGAKDWKYNNDYVDSEDRYRHSKWLSFMEKRLLLSKRLLRKNGLLIVTIDEKEFLRLGLLLEDLFPDAEIQMVSSVISPFGVARGSEFRRVDEKIFYVKFPETQIWNPSIESDQNFSFETFLEVVKKHVNLDDSSEERIIGELVETYASKPADEKKETFWFSLMRAGSNSTRSRSPGCFFPIFTTKSGELHSIGEALNKEQTVSEIQIPVGCDIIWPINEGNIEAVWQGDRDTVSHLFDSGFAKIGTMNKKLGRRSIVYLRSGTIEQIKTGVLELKNGIITRRKKKTNDLGTTHWNFPSHNATSHGTKLLKKLITDVKFPYPKSLYAVEDAIRSATNGKKEAVILDFFGGSGTTLHAVARLNQQDGGNRKCILVTNNSVSLDEESVLKTKGLYPGHPEFEAFGIFNQITMPRLIAAISGNTKDGKPIKGQYKFNDRKSISEGLEANVKFLELTYENHDTIYLNNDFSRIGTICWILQGSKGSEIKNTGAHFEIQNESFYCILFNIDHWQEFVNEVKHSDTITHAFIITDSKVQYQQVVKHLPTNIETTMLYEDYLRNFQIGV